MDTEKNLQTFQAKELENVHWYGRNGDFDGGVALFWTASGFLANCNAKELWAQIEADYDTLEPWAGVWVDGAMIARFPLERGKKWYLLFRKPESALDKPFKIELLKDTQAMAGDEKHFVCVHALCVPKGVDKSAFLPLAPFKAKIEFIGDSLTTGEGLAGASSECDRGSPWISVRTSYALMTAKALGADWRFLSQSGWGVISGWDNDQTSIIPPHYENVCSVAKGEKNENAGAKKANDFSKWQADFVVVNLGTNDFNAFRSPAKTASDGTVWKLRSESDGSLNKEDAKRFQNGIKDFLSKIRRNNHNAQIIWAYGMCSADFSEYIESAVEGFAKETKDTRISFLLLPSMAGESEEGRGSLFHPGSETHLKTSKALLSHIKFLEQIQ